jgi:hypothetical protein
MAHVKLKMNVSREWVLRHAESEPESGIASVGGLASRLARQNMRKPRARRRPPAKLKASKSRR